MADIHFTEDDIQRQLELLGYHNIPRDRLRQFAQDLEKLIEEDKVPPFADDSLYSDLSGHHDTSDQSLADRSHVFQGAASSRSPLNDVNIPSRNHQASKSKQRRASTEQENYESSSNLPEGASKVIDPRLYDTYERRRQVNPAAERKIQMKRKVVRKRGGQSQIFDESVTESESDVSYLNERVQGLPLSDRLQGMSLNRHDEIDEEESETSSVGFSSFRRHISRPNTSQGLYPHRPSGDEDSVYKPHLPRSFIRPSSANPTYKHSKKTDPVTRHQMYQSQWNSQKAPGEKKHKGLRWSVREHMMYKDEVVQPRSTPRVFMPNDYVVPTDKKRQALRWAVRTQLAHKEMPSNSFNF